MGLFKKLIIGACAGWMASRITHTKKKGCIGNVIIGSLGSLVGNLVCQSLFNVSMETFNLQSFAISLIGSVLVLAVFGRRR